MLDNSQQSGLIEYIYAIAIEKISKIDLRKEVNWETAEDFSAKYTAHVKEIPDKVDSISNEGISDNEKVNKLKDLGTPAIPYISQKIEEGQKELAPALDYLTDNESQDDFTNWKKENADKESLLKSFVEQNSK